ncbi:DMT family transporter [Bacillus suaedaesalsae]|uniref:DMT family transporter n=1 Tax=Bacillus suaedaesalsae TaxID=2810349 RepID=A0ABS2DJT8_9BACI|nr:DMT family transporter [Bacillus suaedaesalsae]MBM6618754.1 DMT family transporter [Bacillus suaedaesalsae]
MNPSYAKAYLALVIGIITVSFSAIFVRLADAPSSVTAFYRMFFSVMIMAPLFFMNYKHELKNINKRDWFYSIIAGFFLALHFVLWFESLRFTSVASSTVLVTLQPLFAFIGTYIFFKEKLSLWAVISGVLAVIGSFVISWGDFRISGLALWGDILALIACLLVTVYLLFGQDVRSRLSLITYTFIVYAVSSVTLFLYALVSGDSFITYDREQWMYFVLLAIFPTLLGHTMFNYALKWVSTSVISVTILFEPIGASLLAYYLLNESIFSYQVIGGIIVILGICLFMFSNRKEHIQIESKGA